VENRLSTNFLISSPVLVFYSQTTPSEENSTSLTWARVVPSARISCVRFLSPVPTSHNLTVSSADPDASTCPSEENAITDDVSVAFRPSLSRCRAPEPYCTVVQSYRKQVATGLECNIVAAFSFIKSLRKLGSVHRLHPWITPYAC
jgi:hypothetical protein